jgi:hypothetical protein
MKRRSAHARVTLTVEIAVHSSWGEKCDLAQVYQQAEREAREHLDRYFNSNAGRDCKCTIVGRPKIDAIIVERDER